MSNQKGPSTSSPSNIISFDAASLIKCKLSDDLLSRIAASGSLRSSSCRSAVWRLLLRCLPYDVSDWEVVLSRTRNSYRKLKKTNLIDPHDEQFSQDPQFNNPLAPVEQNPWNSFFEDNELRDIIGKDVGRTFPEIEFFQQDHIRQLMADILLVYAKENPFISYKQGMHEILAPLIFVIFSDIEAYQHAKENDELKALTLQEEDLLNCLFCKEFLEHDSYNLFCAFMIEVSKWYEDTTNSENSKGSTQKEPYLRVQDQTSNTRLMEDLIDIANLLQEIDPTLAKHLNNLDIPPQLYGIRWLRLLFGRELPMHDLLYLWDVLLTDRPIGPLVKCVFVSMLVQIRHLLINNDYGGCLQYLMRYPPIADIDSFIKLARHYRNPKKIARPIIRENNFTHITVAGKSHPNRTQRPGKTGVSQHQAEESPPSILTLAPVFEKVKNSIRDRSNTVSVPSSPRRDANKAAMNVDHAQKAAIWGRQVQLMEEQVSCLQTKLNEKDMVCLQISQSIEKCAEELKKARNPQQCQQLAARLMELSRSLVSNQKSELDQQQQKSRQAPPLPPPPPISRSNEMVDLALTSKKRTNPRM